MIFSTLYISCDMTRGFLVEFKYIIDAMVEMVCHPAPIAGRNSTPNYGRHMTGYGDSH